jgi:energy-converting hydrogenase B subunit D
MVTNMTYLLAGFDILLIATLLWLAWRLLTSEDIFTAVVLFISFGLLMALAWVRLRAPDVALAEAAIGAGLTGPLFLAALRRMERIHREERRLDIDEDRDSDHQTD